MSSPASSPLLPFYEGSPASSRGGHKDSTDRGHPSHAHTHHGHGNAHAHTEDKKLFSREAPTLQRTLHRAARPTLPHGSRVWKRRPPPPAIWAFFALYRTWCHL
jgi:hypothetical protein